MRLQGNQTTRILATSSNLNPAAVTSFSFQAAVPKYCKLEFVRAPSGDSMAPMGKVVQEFDVTNTLQGQVRAVCAAFVRLFAPLFVWYPRVVLCVCVVCV